MEEKGNLKSVAKLTSEYELLCAVFNHSAKITCAGCLDGNVQIFEPKKDGKLIAQCNNSPPDKSFPISCLRFQPGTENLLVSYSSGEVKIWDIAVKTCKHQQKETRQGLTNCWSNDGKFFATTGVDKNVHIYDSVSLTNVTTIVHTGVKGHEICGDQPRVFGIRFHPNDPTSLLTGGWDGTFKFWDLRNLSNFIREFTGPVIASDAMAVHPETKQILTGSFRKKKALQVYSWETGAEIATLADGMMSQAYSVCWATPDVAVFGGAYQHLMKVVNQSDNLVLGEVTNVPDAVYSVDAEGGLISMVAGKELKIYSWYA